VARELSAALGEDGALDEAGTLLEGLAAGVERDRPGTLRRLVRECSMRWLERGADAPAVARALLALVLPRALVARVGGADGPWSALENFGQPVFDTVPMPLLILDHQRRVRMWNRAFTRLAGESCGPLRDRPLGELLRPEGREWAERDLRPDRPAMERFAFGSVRLAAGPSGEFLALGVAIVHGGRLAGWYLALAPEPEAALLELSAAARVQRERNEKNKFAALLTVSHAVANSLELKTILATIAEQVRQVIQTDECTVFLYDEEDKFLKPKVCDADSYRDEIMNVRLRLGEGITGMVAMTGRGEIVNDAERDPRAAQVPGTPQESSSLLCVPLLSREKVVGVITLTRTSGRSFEPEDLELATLFAGHCSTAIANARHYEETRAALVELRETQAQLVQSAKLNALGEMAGGVAHDFNNLLAAVLGRTQLLLQSIHEPGFRRQLEVIEQAALDGAETVRRVQEFTRVRSDEHFVTLCLNEVLREVVELTRPAWEDGPKRDGVAIEVDFDLAARQTIAGSGSELRELFTNLILNAVDALPWGGHIRVTTADVDHEVVARVRDNGIGMDEDTRQRIFDPFFSTKSERGTGLGLSVARGIINRHRGSITVESQPHLGAEFTVRFPAGQSAGPPPAPASPGRLPRFRVLAVDDEKPVLDVLADLLRALGQDVDVALGGSAGLERFEQGDYQVLFTDLSMPEVNGWDLTLAVKSRRADVAVVVVTGWGLQLEEVTAQAHGVDLLVAKPFSIEDLERALHRVGQSLATRGIVGL
jgi:signal transduction histidine kinase/PAS domain-containing protein